MCSMEIIPHCESAEITPELRDDLINFSSDKLVDAFSVSPFRIGMSFTFIPSFLSGLKKLVWYNCPYTAFTYLYNL